MYDQDFPTSRDTFPWSTHSDQHAGAPECHDGSQLHGNMQDLTMASSKPDGFRCETIGQRPVRARVQKKKNERPHSNDRSSQLPILLIARSRESSAGLTTADLAFPLPHTSCNLASYRTGAIFSSLTYPITRGVTHPPRASSPQK